MALNHYLTGSRVVMVATCDVVNPLDPTDKTPTDPTTVTFSRSVNDGPVVTYTNGDVEVSGLAVGIWACVVDVATGATKSREKWRFDGLGACHASAEDQFDVDPSILP